MRVGKYAFLNCAFLLVGLKFQAISLVAQFPIAGARLFAGVLFFSNRFFSHSFGITPGSRSFSLHFFKFGVKKYSFRLIFRQFFRHGSCQEVQGR